MYESRLRRLLIAFVCLFGLLGVRTFQVQVVEAPRFTKVMNAKRELRPQARRGRILWGDGSPMAENVPGYGLEIVWGAVDDRLLPTVDELRASMAERVAIEAQADERAVEAETLARRRVRVARECAQRRADRASVREKLVAKLADLRPKHLEDGVRVIWECGVCGHAVKAKDEPERACTECQVQGEFAVRPLLDVAELASLLGTDLFGAHEAFVDALGRKFDHPTWRSHAFRVRIPAYAAEAISLERDYFGGFEPLPRTSRDVDPVAWQIVGSTRLPSQSDFDRLEDESRRALGLHVYDDSEIFPLLIGASLLERAHDEELRGAPGYTVSTRDPDRDFAWQHDVIDPVADGVDLRTTLRRDLQECALRIVETAPDDGHAAAVVLDVRDGAVLAMASTQRDGMNHARCPVTPGSVYKLVTALAGLEAGISPETTQFCAERGRVPGGGRYVCEHRDGDIALVDAFSRSCNGFFAQQAVAAGSEAMASAASRLGLGEQHLVADLGRDQAREAGLGLSGPETRTWYPQDLAYIGIGQGYASASPLQIVTAFARVASGGRMVTPFVLERSRREPSSIPVDPGLARWAPLLREAARRVVVDGTAAKIDALRAVDAAGKTGTAEVDRKFDADTILRTNNAWFVGYAPHDAPRYCVVVVIEGLAHGEHNYGGSIAGPAVGELLAEALRE